MRTRPGDHLSSDIEKGDVVWIDYTGWILHPDGRAVLFDTTNEELAKKEDKHEEKKVYAEVPVVVGHGRLLTGLEDAILSAKVGVQTEVEFPPEKGAGERDPKLVELHPIREFLRQDIHPEVGMEVAVRGKKGRITVVTPGRVRVDFNNPLAGRTVRYAFKVTKKAENQGDKVRGILDMDYGLSEQFGVTVKDDTAEIQVPDVCKTDERWFVSKFRAVADLREFAGLRKIRFIEEYEARAPPKEEKPNEGVTEKPEAAEKPPKAKRRRRKAKPAEKEEPPAEGPPEAPELVEEELPPSEKAPEEL